MDKEVKDLDELWDETAGTPVCPKCGSYSLYGHITEIKGDLASVDWVCEDCGYKWSSRCPFEDGCLTPVEVDGSWIGLDEKAGLEVKARMRRDESELCPICGSEMIDMSNISFPHLTCSRCGSEHVIYLMDAKLFEKRGSKLVVKRSVESVVLDCLCEDCGHKWSVFCICKDGVFTVVGSKV